MKPLMEKRRRARINDSLNHLKNLILPLTGRDVSYNIHFNTRKTVTISSEVKMFMILVFNNGFLYVLDSLLQAGESRYPGNDREVPRRHSP